MRAQNDNRSGKEVNDYIWGKGNVSYEGSIHLRVQGVFYIKVGGLPDGHKTNL
jgi:hypothetical protein